LPELSSEPPESLDVDSSELVVLVLLVLVHAEPAQSKASKHVDINPRISR
jgi:hypothetical protein